MRSGKEPNTPVTSPRTSKTETPKAHSKDRDIGSALRSAWQDAVDEHVPDDMLDLLRKLD